MKEEILQLTYLTNNGEVTIDLVDSQEDACEIQLRWNTTQVQSQIELPLGDVKIRFNIASIGNWPEFKTEMVNRCVSTPFGRVCTKVPQAFTRTCKKTVYAEISFPQAIETAVRSAVTTCATAAAIAAVAAAISGGAAAALPVFSASFESCIEISASQYASQIKLRVSDETKCGNWTPR